MGSESGVSAREAAAQAAVERQAAAEKTPFQSAEARERREKDILVGKIQAVYAELGRDSPLGLPASWLSALRDHLAYIKDVKRNGSQREKKEDQLRRKMNL